MDKYSTESIPFQSLVDTLEPTPFPDFKCHMCGGYGWAYDFNGGERIYYPCPCLNDN